MKRVFFLLCTFLYAASASSLNVEDVPNKIVHSYTTTPTYYFYIDLFDFTSAAPMHFCKVWQEVDVWQFGPPTIRTRTYCI